jgi:microcystin-dependent protein
VTIETATYVNDLQAVNPPSTDPVSQGDDHIRLLKTVLQNTFLNATRAFTVPGAFAYSTNQTLAKTHGESVIYCATASGAVTFTLPSLAALDAGWKCYFIKTSSDANPMFIKAAVGNVNSGGVASLAQARRCIPGAPSVAIWDGANWFIGRVLALPIGSCIEYLGTTLPPGFEWPNGQALSSAANYPEYSAVMGTLITKDKRGYTSIAMDNLGGVTPAGRLPSGIILGSTMFAVGGQDAITLTVASLPPHQHQVFVHETGHTHSIGGANQFNSNIGLSAFGGLGPVPQSIAAGSSGSAISGVTVGSVSGVASDNKTDSGSTLGLNNANHNNLQPSIMVNQILVVE